MLFKFEDKLNRKLNVREQPDSEAVIVRQIESGTQFEGERVDNWVWLGDGFVMASLVSESQEDESPLAKMSLKELRELAEQSDVKLKAGMKKAEIIKALLDE